MLKNILHDTHFLAMNFYFNHSKVCLEDLTTKIILNIDGPTFKK